jgi:hypothetical protein
VSLGEAGARPGTGAAPYAGLPLVRAHLAERLERGHSLDRPWAALALGVLGHGLREAGLDCDPELDRALIRALRAAKAPQELGACALACGMRRIEGALGDLLAALDAVAEDEARGFIAVGLGLLGDSDALEPVQQARVEVPPRAPTPGSDQPRVAGRQAARAGADRDAAELDEHLGPGRGGVRARLDR